MLSRAVIFEVGDSGATRHRFLGQLRCSRSQELVGRGPTFLRIALVYSRESCWEPQHRRLTFAGLVRAGSGLPQALPWDY